MPNEYTRKQNTPKRGCWSAENLTDAVNAVVYGQMGVNEAAKAFGIPKTTFKRRFSASNLDKTDRLGPGSVLGREAEMKLSTHIKKLQKSGFAPTRGEVRVKAYNLAERLGIEHKFNREEGKAGNVWLLQFLRRNPDITVRKAENTSIARALGMSRNIVEKYFKELDAVLSQNSLFDKPGNIYNTDETGLQLNTRAVVACCNAEGVYLPPYCVFKGKNAKAEWADGMPPASRIRMSEKSAYVTSDIFLDWLQNHFYPRKVPGKVLLIVDGHTSHTTNLDTLQFAEDHDIILFCLPSHTTHYLQPLDRAFFKSLKGHYYESCRRMIKCNPNRKLNRLQFGKLLGEAWGKSATVNNAVSAFRSTGIWPYNPNEIPDHAFLTQPPNEAAIHAREEEEQTGSTAKLRETETLSRDGDSPQPGPSGMHLPLYHESPQPGHSKKQLGSVEEEETPGKLLQELSPVPQITPAIRKARVNLMGDLTSPNHIALVRQKKQKQSQTPHPKGQRKEKPSKNKLPKSTDQKLQKKRRHESTSSESDGNVILDDSSSGEETLDDIENQCVGCLEDYRLTKKKEEWLQCIVCSRWLHDGCTSYTNTCQRCGAAPTLKKGTKTLN
ncbi:uncharacterized protein LOC116171810 [Photinus pyralis]|uniref:uncharacterized protein LOC116171810 n=1 Tax=Photinus pyralis TaxID=7054 RepID=UPI00126732E6|nr:uncharacterized protein LOC116171810 [Photinus pyralis]